MEKNERTVSAFEHENSLKNIVYKAQEQLFRHL